MNIEIKRRGKVRLSDISFSNTFKLVDGAVCYMKADTTHLANGVVNFDKDNTCICVNLLTGVLDVFDLSVAVEIIDIKAEVLL